MPNKRNTIQFDERGIDILRSLLAHMMVQDDSTRWIWNDTLRQAELPDYLDLEKWMIDAIYETVRNGGYPIKENIVQYIAAVYGVEARDAIYDIAGHSQARETTDIEGLVKQSYANFLGWWEDAKVGTGLESIVHIWNDPSEDTKAQRWEKIQTMLNKIAPQNLRRDIYRTDEERYRAFIEQHQKAIERGRSAYPKFPIQALNDKVSAIYPENPVLISGKSKTGKSIFVAELAEWFAWHEGLYVLVITLESDIRQWESRWWARHFGIPTSAWTGDTFFQDLEKKVHNIPQINLNDKRWQKFISQDIKMEYVERRNEARGKIVLERTPGWSIPNLSRVVNDNLRIAERMGMPMIVLVDYLQKSVWGNMGKEGELELLTRYANSWKLLTERTKIFSVMFSQETEDKSSGEIKAYGSSIPHTVFQLQLSIQRPPFKEKKEPLPAPEYVVTETKSVLCDAFGNKRFYAAEEGDLSGLRSSIKIVASNDGSRGSVPVWIEGKYSSIVDPAKAFRKVQNDSGEMVYDQWGVHRYPFISWRDFS